jgi:signal transduction histidine kinase
VKKAPPLEARLGPLLDVVARMAGGDFRTRAPISSEHDEVDALAFGLNLLGGELAFTLDGLRRARHETERAHAERETFFRHITHELRTPIAGILLIVESLRTPGLPEEKRRDLVERIERMARGLLRLVDQVLDLSRIEAERLEPARALVSIGACVRSAVAAFELEAERKSLRLEVVAADGVPALVTDEALLQQILLNVVGNAVKFSEKGGVEVRTGSDTDGVTVDVVDTGVGISKADRARLFEPFARGRAHAARFPGSGLGLVISRRLARALGGDLVLVRSNPRRGSHFRLTLPTAGVP